MMKNFEISILLVLLSFALVSLHKVDLSKKNEKRPNAIFSNDRNLPQYGLDNRRFLEKEEEPSLLLSNKLLRVGVNVSAANALIPPLVNGLFPQLVDSLEGNIELDASESAGECCDFGDVGGQVSAQLHGFFLDPINEKLVNISVSPGPIFPSNSIRLTVNTGRVGAGFTEVGLAASFAAIFPVDCSVFATVEAEIENFALVLDVFSDPESSSRKFSVKASDFRVEGIGFKFKPVVDNVCSVVAEFVNIIFTLLTVALQKLLTRKLNEILQNFALENIPQSDFEMPPIPPINITKNNSLLLDYNIPNFFVQDDSIIVEADIKSEAALQSPRWRKGSSYKNTYSSGKLFPEPIKKNLVNANIGADGLNDLFDKVWYLLWAEASGGNRTSMFSPLCQKTENDPCALPPLRQVYGINDSEYYAFLPFGIHRRFMLNAIINPPQLEFESGSLMSGTTSVALLLEGITMLGGKRVSVAEMTADINLRASSLKYNPITGIFSGLQITRFSVEDLRIDDSIRPLRTFTMNILLTLIERVLNSIFRVQLQQKANEAILEALTSIPQIPVIPDFPTSGNTLIINMTEVVMTGISATSDTQSVAYMGAGISMKIQEDSTTAKKVDVNIIVKDQKDDYVQKKIAATALQWAEESNGNPNAYFSWTYQNTNLHVMEAQAYHYDDNLKLMVEDVGDAF